MKLFWSSEIIVSRPGEFVISRITCHSKMSLEGFRTLNLLQFRDNLWSAASGVCVCVCDGGGLKILPEIDIYLKNELLG